MTIEMTISTSPFSGPYQGQLGTSQYYAESMRQLREQEEYERQYRNQQTNAYYSQQGSITLGNPSAGQPVAIHTPGAERRRSTILLLKEEE